MRQGWTQLAHLVDGFLSECGSPTQGDRPLIRGASLNLAKNYAALPRSRRVSPVPEDLESWCLFVYVRELPRPGITFPTQYHGVPVVCEIRYEDATLW